MATVRLALSGSPGADSAAMAARLGAGTRPVRAKPDVDERRMLREAQGGSDEALELLVRRNWPLAYRAAYLVVGDSAAAEDVAQEALVAAIRALDSFDRRRPFGPWLHRIAVNRAIDWARAAKLRAELEERDVPAPERADSDERMLPALASLDPDHRAVIVLRYLLEYTPGEIAELLDLPRGTVNSRLRRGLDKLKERLE